MAVGVIKAVVFAGVFSLCAVSASAETLVEQDASCAEANRAHQATIEAQRSSFKTYLVEADGPLKLFSEAVIGAKHMFSREGPSAAWGLYPRIKWSALDGAAPKLTDCLFEGDEKRGGFSTKHYSVTRHESGQVSRVNIWVMENDGRISEARYGPFDVKLKTGTALVEIWFFDGNAGPLPE